LLDLTLLREASETRDCLLGLQHEVERTRSDYHHAIRRLNAAGGSFREIADSLGLSHQRVHQIVDEGASEEVTADTCETFLQRLVRRRRKSGAGPFHRFTSSAREVVVHAQQEAHALSHNYIGTEHLLLGLLRVEDGVAAKALVSLQVEYAAVRAEVERVVGRGEGTSAGRLPFTPRSKKTLELALRESLALKHDHIGTEHILLGLLRENEGVAATILIDLGADAATIRAAVTGRPAA
jgi:Clp amino terminal domain, pathogenicity island component